MQINNSYNNSPNFGRLIPPKSQSSRSELAKLVGLPENLKAFRQFIKEQDKLYYFDLKFDEDLAKNSMVYIYKQNDFIDSYGLNNKDSIIKKTKNPLKKLYYKIFKPMFNLPAGLIEAGNKAKRLDAKELNKIAAENALYKAFNS